MENKRIYNPFGLKNYYLLDKGKKTFLSIDNLELEISENGYIPKSGLIFDTVLTKRHCKDKKVLDIGCGYLGILGVIAYLKGAKSVDSVDCDKSCVKWFSNLIKENKLNNINCFYSDFFSEVKDLDYDLVLANPPIMPMLNGDVHDSGGPDGRNSWNIILREAQKYLKPNGKLIILAFDFLGTDKKTNSNKSLVEIAKDCGFVHNKKLVSVPKVIKKGGVTFESINYIQKIYPNYQFKTDENGNKICQTEIFEFSK